MASSPWTTGVALGEGHQEETGALSSNVSGVPAREAIAKALDRLTAQLLDVVLHDERRSGLMSGRSFPALYSPQKQQLTEDY